MQPTTFGIPPWMAAGTAFQAVSPAINMCIDLINNLHSHPDQKGKDGCKKCFVKDVVTGVLAFIGILASLAAASIMMYGGLKHTYAWLNSNEKIATTPPG
ncbi:hypothetical protein [Candidatus Neptunochlamydia vexilliferae]|uniref:hypothetical protein n=1 Tax=Candidatus Neptunichlamydia vexilliferae TaxID=1651774 RepID=UPI001891EF70|nr:hypothetical protein [Candidatus Neptunochlamydia vexilliferae]